MTVVPAVSTLKTERYAAVRLCEYAQIIQYDERAFFGLRYPNMQREACREIWTKAQRDVVQRYLSEAQYEIEQQVMFPLEPRWIADEQPYVDDVDLRNRRFPSLARWRYIISPGIRAEADIELAAIPDFTNDPAEIVTGIPAGMTVVDSEVYVYLPGTDYEIVPSSIVVDALAGTITILIPWARMVSEANRDNPETGWDYTDTGVTGPYTQTVDVKRIYNDDATQAILYKQSSCTVCTETPGTACIRVFDPAVSTIKLMRQSSAACSCGYDRARLYYLAGMSPTTLQAKEAVTRLAHAKMPYSPCGCDPATNAWAMDRSFPAVNEYAGERRVNPFGVANGAWAAWQWTISMMIGRGYTL